jgi:hypothetical protein
MEIFGLLLGIGLIVAFVALCIAVVGVIIWLFGQEIRVKKIARTAHRVAAAHVGLTRVVERRGMGVALNGHAGPFRVSLVYGGKRGYPYDSLITVYGNGHIQEELDLRAEGVASRIDKALGDQEVVIGDAGFDSEIYARGPEDILRAMCNARTRSLLRALVRWNGAVAGGNVSVTTTKAGREPEPVTAVLTTALDLARRLLPPENIVECLADLVRNDPETGVRERCLLYLVRTRPEHPTVAAVIREALTMPCPELRVRAAIALGAEGRNTLLELVGSTDLNAECAADGIHALGEVLSEPRRIEILQEALRLERGPVVRALIEALRLRGTAAAVAPLRAVIEAHAFGGGLRREAEQAIARIQSRLEDAAAGRISLAEGLADVGQLSLSDSAAGQLSLNQPAGTQSNVPSKPASETE